MAASEIDYAKLLQRALRTVVREVMVRTERDGLPGEHHFYITLRTDHSGVELPPFVRQRYPEEMTVILQHQFWDLAVDDEGFAVTLRFDGMPARVRTPWDAVVAFFDPTAEFGLRFDLPGLAGAGGAQQPVGPRPVVSESADGEATSGADDAADGGESKTSSTGAAAPNEPAEGTAKVLAFGRPREKRDDEDA